jgi:putative oxidoreductase
MKSTFYDSLATIGRVLIAFIFIAAGIGKVMNYGQTIQLMSAHGLAGALLPAVIALELFGGLALAFGFLTRLVTAGLAIFSVAAITIFLLPPPNQQGMILVLAEIAMIGGLLSYAAAGGGRFSMDRILFGKVSRGKMKLEKPI